MSKRYPKYEFSLNSQGIKDLSFEEIKAILRAADELIAAGGRSLLSKILKGSKDKKVMKHNLDSCPVYGFYKSLPLPEITKRVDWMIDNGYLGIDYAGKLPVIVFSKTGWEIERETYAEELFQKMQHLLDTGDYSFVSELKDRNRGMILLLIEKIQNTDNPKFIPLLKAWQAVDYKKVQAALQRTIHSLST
ncbi:MAG: hypothetical protein J7L95_08040 [Prolixibacteraceae bacterium]|nr:hypothetical protein [Prolixibacteraceae bacterium]